MNNQLTERKLLNKIFSIKNIYQTNEYEVITSIHKQICFLGLKVKLKRKFSKFENNLINQLTNIHKSCKMNSRENYVFGNFYIQERLESEKPENRLLVENLYKNLDNDARSNLDNLLSRNSRIIQQKKKHYTDPWIKDVYTNEEINELEKVQKFHKEIEQQDNYYQWKNFKLPINSFGSQIFIHKYGLNILRHKETIQDAILDVGAFIGDSAIFFRDEFPDNQIICFEPEEKNYNLCLETLKLNNSQKIIVEKLGHEEKKYSTYIDGTGGAAKIKEYSKQQVNITTLDDYVNKNNINVGLIKVDIEGFEKNFIEGAKETLRTQAPTLLLSIYHSTDDFFTIKPMVEEIMKDSPFEYRYDFFEPVSQYSIFETLLICEKKL